MQKKFWSWQDSKGYFSEEKLNEMIKTSVCFDGTSHWSVKSPTHTNRYTSFFDITRERNVCTCCFPPAHHLGIGFVSDFYPNILQHWNTVNKRKKNHQKHTHPHTDTHTPANEHTLFQPSCVGQIVKQLKMTDGKK